MHQSAMPSAAPFGLGKSLILGALFVFASLAATFGRPTVDASSPAPDLARVIPDSFGQWRLDDSISPIQVSPDVRAQLAMIYDETLARTYVNASGERVMLSLAYGRDQRKGSQVHKPEVCYPAQGFAISRIRKVTLPTFLGEIPAMRMVAQQGPRVEPLTYWIRVGDKSVRGAIEQNIARVEYGLKGRVPDGILVRVSSISKNEDQAFELQSRFISDLLESSPESVRHLLVGSTRLEGT